MIKRVRTGMAWGIVATISMSTFHLLAKWLGLFPVWPPTPAAVVKRLFGSDLPLPLLIALAIGFHLAYGAFWGGTLWAIVKRITVWNGVALGIFLWLIMQVAVFPVLGWGIFASKMNPKIAAAALVEHLVFGTILGWLGARRTVLSRAAETF
jgi:hypothetical protein